MDPRLLRLQKKLKELERGFSESNCFEYDICRWCGEPELYTNSSWYISPLEALVHRCRALPKVPQEWDNPHFCSACYDFEESHRAISDQLKRLNPVLEIQEIQELRDYLENRDDVEDQLECQTAS